MGVVLEFESQVGNSNNIDKVVKRDEMFNKMLAKRCMEYWAALGHNVKYSVHYDPIFKIHSIKTDDLRGGLPYKEKVTPIARKRLTTIEG